MAKGHSHPHGGSHEETKHEQTHEAHDQLEEMKGHLQEAQQRLADTDRKVLETEKALKAAEEKLAAALAKLEKATRVEPEVRSDMIAQVAAGLWPGMKMGGVDEKKNMINCADESIRLADTIIERVALGGK